MKKNEIRQREVLRHLVEEYIATGEPVSSKLLCQQYVQNASPATIRIDLSKLEKQNLVYQQHTSAGRVPTIQGYRTYIQQISHPLEKLDYENNDMLRDILVKYYHDIPMALHYIMQLLAKETDQLSFVAEPEISYGYLEKLEVFKVGATKLLFVVSLDSGIDKTVILNYDHPITEQQLKAIVRYINDRMAGRRLYDIQERYLEEMAQKISEENKLLILFLEELYKVITEISKYYIHFDGRISFLEQPEFDDKSAILRFLGFIQRQDQLVGMMQKHDKESAQYNVLLGEDFCETDMANYSLVYARYEIFGVPGYLGILGPARMNYRRNIPIIRDMAKIITNTTNKGIVVSKHER